MTKPVRSCVGDRNSKIGKDVEDTVIAWNIAILAARHRHRGERVVVARKVRAMHTKAEVRNFVVLRVALSVVDRDTVVIIQRDFHRQFPVGGNLTVQALWTPRHRAHRVEDGEAFTEIVLEAVRGIPSWKPTEDERSAGGNVQSDQFGADLAWMGAEYFQTIGDPDRMAVSIVVPVVKATNDRAVPLVGRSQGKKPMGAAILKSLNRVTESLHEYRPTAQGRTKPVSILLQVWGNPEKRPAMPQLGLFLPERPVVDKGTRPIGRDIPSSTGPRRVGGAIAVAVG